MLSLGDIPSFVRYKVSSTLENCYHVCGNSRKEERAASAGKVETQKMEANLVTLVCGTIGLVSLVNATTRPFFSLTGLLVSGTCGLLSWECSVVTSNLSNLLKAEDCKAFLNVKSLTYDAFIKHAFKNTWIARPLCVAAGIIKA